MIDDWTAGGITAEAHTLVTGARAKTHGGKTLNHQNIADLWNAYLGNALMPKLKAHDVAVMMCLLKIARMKLGETNRDNYVDLAGYAGVAGEIMGETNGEL